MIDIQFTPYIAPQVPVYTNDGAQIGTLTCDEDVQALQIQLLEKGLTDQVYLLFEGQKITFNQMAELSEWPKGFFDVSERRYMDLFRLRQTVRGGNAKTKQP